MKNSKILMAGAVSLFVLSSCSSAKLQEAMHKVMGSGGDALTSTEVASGLKQALEKGSEYAVKSGSGANSFLNNAKIKIPFPPEAQDIQSKLNSVGMTSVTEKFVATLNHAAETAAAKAKPVFVDAIRAMTVQDAFAILRGSNDAATQYLKKTTGARLREEFLPVVKGATEKVQLTKYWTPVMTAYNAIPFTTAKQNPDLNAYVTEKALDGLFTLVAEEEGKIRANPVERTTELLKKVFGAQAQAAK